MKKLLAAAGGATFHYADVRYVATGSVSAGLGITC
jgi:hypothetical protein